MNRSLRPLSPPDRRSPSTTDHPPHAVRPSAAAGPGSGGPRPRGRLWRRGAVAVLAAGLGLATAGCLASAPPGPPPAVANAIQGAFGNLGPGVVSCMTDVAYRESHWDPAARNASGASGLFQILLPLHDDLFTALGVPPSAWSDPNWNALTARELYNGSGIAPWGRC
jgi:hypothetical protein